MKATGDTAPSTSPLYPDTHGHIIDLIVKYSPYPTLIKLRKVSRSLHRLVDRILGSHLKIHAEKDKDDCLVIETPNGRLPSFYSRKTILAHHEPLPGHMFAFVAGRISNLTPDDDNAVGTMFLAKKQDVEWLRLTLRAADIVEVTGALSSENQFLEYSYKDVGLVALSPATVPHLKVNRLREAENHISIKLHGHTMFPFRSPKFNLVVNLSTEYPPAFHWLEEVTPIPKCTKEFYLTINLDAFEQDWKLHTMDGAMKATMCYPDSIELLVLSFEKIRSRIVNNGRPLISYRLLFMILFKMFYNLAPVTKVRIVGLESFIQTPFKAETPVVDPYDYFRNVVAFFYHNRTPTTYPEIFVDSPFPLVDTPVANLVFVESTWISSSDMDADLTNVNNPADWSSYNRAFGSGQAVMFPEE